MEAGVSTACFYPMETKDSFEFLAKNGVKRVELFFNSFSEVKQGYIEVLEEIKNKYGVKVVSLHPFTCVMEPLLFFSQYPNRFEDGMELYSSYFRTAKRLGAEIFVLHGDFMQNAFPVQEGYGRIQKLTEFAAQFGVTVAHENVVRCKSADPQYLLGLKQYYPNMKFVLDVKQAVRSGKDPMVFVNMLGDSIIHIHMSDNKKGEDCLPIGEGTMDMPAFVSELKDVGFVGTVLLELYRDNFETEGEVLKSYIKMQKILEDRK